APAARVVHLDVDPREVGKLRHANVSLVGPLRQALAELTAALTAAGLAPATCAGWRDELEAWRRAYPYWYPDDGDVQKPQAVLETLRDVTAGHDVIWTTGVGQHQMWAMQY